MLFVLSVKAKFPDAFVGRRVLDVGSLDVNGSNRQFFTDCAYTGIDVAPGVGVDAVTSAHSHKVPDEWYETIISTEAFEHDKYLANTLKAIVRMLAPKGLFLFTCATTGRGEHGTSRSNPHDCPGIPWDHYENVTEEMVRSVLDMETVFSEHGFQVVGHDLYGYGVKR